jgi:hypothetical protein
MLLRNSLPLVGEGRVGGRERLDSIHGFESLWTSALSDGDEVLAIPPDHHPFPSPQGGGDSRKRA